jgi:Ricin-type beta-trefoil lectin domain/PQQ-like domain/Abnormal spindle-like microcephaly-assoc'd, ASPM-SPD-2-Hydin
MLFGRAGRRITVVVAVAFAVLGLAPTVTRADEPTIGYTKLRPNWDANEPGLTLSAVGQPDFGQLWATTLPRPAGEDAVSFPNQMYAQPIVADGHVIVATEDDQVNALDPATGAVQWTRRLGPGWAPTVSCGDLTPHVGITSTPVYQPATKTIYLITKTDNGPDADHPVMRMHALDVATGAERAGWPIRIAGRSTNGGQLFNPRTANQRVGLLLMGGAVYFATASHCDQGPYVGYVGRVTTTSTPTLTLWSSESNGSSSEAGIWQSGAGLVSDGPGRIFLATGNGVSPPPGPGNSPPGTLAESVVRLAVAADGTMSAKDFFSPANNQQLDGTDADLGSGGPVPLPDGWGSAAHPHLITITGKDGVVRLLDRDNLGGMGQGPGGTDDVVSALNLKGVWGRPAIYDAPSGHYLYLLPSQSPLEALQVAPDAHGNPTLSVAGASVDSYGYTSGSPIVTSDGSQPGAVVWVVTVSGSSGSSAMVRAFPAVPPVGGNWRPVASFPLGTAAKFVQPATDGGRLFVGTRDGRVLAFGRPTAEAVTAAPTDFGLVPVNGQVTQNVTITAHGPVTIDGVATNAPFTAGATTPPLPHDFTAGQTLTVPVTFAPTTPDTASDVLTVHTHVGTGATNDYPFALTGTGTQDGLAASPAPLDFSTVVIGRARQLGVTIRNTGTTTVTVTGTTAPSAPFSSTSIPAQGFTLAAQASVTVNVRFAPTADGPASGSFAIGWMTSGSSGTLTVPLQGAGTTGAPILSIASPIAFGDVDPGSSRTLDMVVSNVGNATMTITKAAVPAAPFVVPTPLAEGQTLNPGDVITVPITVAPRSAMPISGAYSVTADDGQGPVVVGLTANNLPWTGPIRSSFGCIDLYGNIRQDGATVDLWGCNGSGAQDLTFGAAGSLRIGPANSMWCLGAAGGGTVPGTRVKLYTCDGSAGQRFRWGSSARLLNPVSKLCLQPLQGSSFQGTVLVLASCTSADYQKWDASELVATRGELSSGLGAVHQLCLTDRGAVTQPGTPLEIDPCTTTPSQIVTHWGSQLRVVNQCLTASATTVVTPASVHLMPCSGARSQVFTSLTGGRLQNPRTKLCLAVRGGRSAPGTPITLATCALTAAQKWRLPG